ncbi:MAG: LysM peptidoglycan-binding domain-containing protein [Clostridiales bacterium]|nr:LysM peptidoglycan-binding domain-containing protein [Clostridiales bacterium]
MTDLEERRYSGKINNKKQLETFHKIRRLGLLLCLILIVCICKYDTAYADAPQSSAYKEAEDCIISYFEALSEGNPEKASDIFGEKNDSDRKWRAYRNHAAKSCGMERYELVEICGYPVGDDEDEFFFVVIYDLWVKGIDVALPGLECFLAGKENGKWSLCWNLTVEGELKEIWENENIADKVEECNEKYYQIKEDNEKVVKWEQDVQNATTEEYAADTINKTKEDSYIVKAGDSLWTISEKKLGDGMKWTALYETNRDVIGDNPDLILPDMELSLLIEEENHQNQINDLVETILKPIADDAADIYDNATDIDDMKQARTEFYYSVSAEFKDGKIVLFDEAAEKELASFDEEYDSGGLYLSMTDENNGVLLYCSTPAAGQMMKLMYVTKDRWKTCSKIDISTKIDGYPTSLTALSDKHLYIGAQMRSDGYLFETVDGGASWNPVIIDEAIEKCRYGYAPIYNSEDDNFYLLLECVDFYALYRADATLSTWKRVGDFVMETGIGSYFIWDGSLIIEDMEGQYFQLLFN